ncbi:MAG: hypothetical protein ACJ72Z_01710, partial [Pyrinomonadaceae bacterium]
RDDYKPDSISGRTLQFNLKYAALDEEATISVFKIADYKRAFANYPQYLENRDSELLVLINDGSALKSYGIKPPPHVTWMDAGELFYSKAKKIDFLGGRGIITLTNISQEGNITIANSGLEYLFQGFTTDGQFFVQMDFPIKFKGLSDESEEFLSPDSPSFNSPAHEAAYLKYLLKTAERIDKAPPRDFQPSAYSIEEFIHRFEVKP